MSVREPLARTVSAYYLAVRTRSIPRWPLNEGLRRIMQCRPGDQYEGADWVISFGMYARHLRRYLDYFSKESLLVLLFDDIEADPRAASESVFDFLGVERLRKGPPPPRNQGVYSPVRLRLQRIASLPLYVRGRDGRYKRARQGFAPRAFAKGVGLVDRELVAPWVAQSNHPEQLADDVREALVDRLGADLSDLESIVGQPLDAWKATMVGASGTNP